MEIFIGIDQSINSTGVTVKCFEREKTIKEHFYIIKANKLTKKDYKYAQNIWYKTVENYEKDMNDNDVWYKKPSNVVGMLVEPISGKPSSNQSDNKKLVYYLKGTEPKGDEPVFDEIENN